MELIAPYFKLSPDPAIWTVQLLLIGVITICCNFVLLRLLDFFGRKEKKRHAPGVWDGALLKAARLPLRLLMWVGGLSAAVSLLHAIEPLWLHNFLLQARRVMLIGIATLFITRFIANMEKGLLRAGSGHRLPDATTVYAMGRLLRLCALAIAALAVAEALGMSISGLLAFGGIGGMAIGFAAKDMLSNFFGGLMIYLDKPFTVGDWIRSPDRNIEGVVEEIGWRMTRIRTFEMRPLYVPNSIFSSIAVENPSRMRNRRIYETLSIRYSDADKMAAICDDVRGMLEKHPDIANEQTIIVHFMTCNASSLDFMVYCYTRTTEWVPYHAVKQDVMLKIMDIVARHGAEFPFPTRTLYMAGGEGDAAAQAAMQAESPRQAMSAAAAPPADSAAPSRPAPGAGAQ